MFASAPSFNVPAPARIVAVLLALSATGISAALSIVSASERGGWAVERAIWIGVSLVLLTGAHCLPALSRYLPRVARVLAAAIISSQMFLRGCINARHEEAMNLNST